MVTEVKATGREVEVKEKQQSFYLGLTAVHRCKRHKPEKERECVWGFRERRISFFFFSILPKMPLHCCFFFPSSRNFLRERNCIVQCWIQISFLREEMLGLWRENFLVFFG